MPYLSLLAVLALGGCAATALPAAPSTHPASALASAAPAAQGTAALAPAEQPVLPAALRGGHAASMDHGTIAESGTAAAGALAASVPGLTETLDAYLAVHDALAGDRLADATAQAAALDAAFETLTAQPPADDAHLWHTNAADLAAVRAQVASLAAASDLDAARAAFGTLSVPLIRLVRATGVPAGYDLALMACGMAPGVPEGGVWMQRAGTTANPFFGATMARCGTQDGRLSADDVSADGVPGGGGSTHTDHAGH